MTHPVDNSHYIAKHLTKPWEYTDAKGNERQLWYYDFDRDCFETRSARNLYTTEEPWAAEVETFLNRYLETPLSAYLTRFLADRTAEPNEKQLRAMKATLLLQIERTQNTIHEVVQKGEEHLNNLVMASDVLYDYVGFPLKQNRLMFSEHGFFMIPMLGSHPLLAIPLAPSYFCVACPKGTDRFIKTVADLRELPDILSGLSMGFDRARRVVVPGYLMTSDPAEQAKLAGALKRLRDEGKYWAKRTIDVNVANYGEPFPKPFTPPIVAQPVLPETLKRT